MGARSDGWPRRKRITRRSDSMLLPDLSLQVVSIVVGTAGTGTAARCSAPGVVPQERRSTFSSSLFWSLLWSLFLSLFLLPSLEDLSPEKNEWIRPPTSLRVASPTMPPDVDAWKYRSSSFGASTFAVSEHAIDTRISGELVGFHSARVKSTLESSFELDAPALGSRAPCASCPEAQRWGPRPDSTRNSTHGADPSRARRAPAGARAS